MGSYLCNVCESNRWIGISAFLLGMWWLQIWITYRKRKIDDDPKIKKGKRRDVF